MKKIILIQSLLLVIFSYAQNSGFTATKNYIYSKDCLNEDCTKTAESVQYFDQLGRVEQVVGIKASPGGKDIVSHVPYDRFGRQVDGWLPVALNSQNGGIHDSAAVKSQAISFYGDSRPFTHKTLDNSPLDITTAVYRQGEAWQNHPAGMQYDANTAGEVKKYTATFVWSEGRTLNTLIPNATYAENSLRKIIQTDEDGNVSIEFKNKKGEVVLSRKVVGTSENADTYYVYNSLGQLAYVIPPLAAAANSIDQNTLDNLCYQYRYDGLGRLAEKKQPGKGWEYMVYDKANRLILTQDANMRSNGKWFISKYDAFGRVIYTGIIAGGSRESMQSQASGNIITETRDNTGFAKSAMQVYYTNSFFSQIETVLSVNYYDTYPTDAPAIPSQIIGQNVLTQDAQNAVVSTKALPVASYVKNVEEDTWTKTFSWYDTRGRVIGSHSVNYLGGYTKTETELDFAGVVQRTKTYHKRLNTDTERVIAQRFDYDAQNRLQKQWHTVGGFAEELLAENAYNELSQLTNKKVGNGLQSIDYTYDIRGTVTKVNDPSSLGLHLFGYELKSFNPQNTVSSIGKYNGNITEADWKTSTDNVLRRYSYQYDGLNRLKKGIFSEPNASIPQNDFYNETVAYDLNGNIQTLQRSGNNYTGSAQLIDNLSYAYTGNRLQTVTDNSGNYAGYPDVSGNAITYDDNGNMKDQKDKGILQINYNYLNLPDYMKFDKTYVPRIPFLGDYNVNTKYLYRADGTKLKKVYTYGSGKANNEVSTTTEYLDGFQYEYVDTGALLMAIDLKFVPTSEGYYNFENNKYIYNYTDHLGNVRLSYFRNGTNGSAEVLEENNYYPFGLKQQNFISAGGSAYKYQYNGKELQGETGWNDYGWRQYMPEIGRWNGMDQLTEDYYSNSPYSYVLNNPILYLDPDGRLSQSFLNNIWSSSSGTTWYNNNDGTFTNSWGDMMTNDGAALNFNTSEGRYWGRSGFVNVHLEQVIIPYKGNLNTWRNESNLAYNRFLMESKILEALRNWNYDVNSSNMGQYIMNSKASMEVAAVEKFLFLELPASFAGGELLTAGWRAANLSRYVCGPLGRLTNGLIKICFTEGTLVATEKGSKKIEDVEEGDLVWSYNEETGTKELKKVVALSRNTSSSLVKISVNGTEITCTPEHPFYVNGSWIEAKNLTKGMLLTTLDGTASPVASINFLDEKVKVYNFEVEGNHNYYVSEKGILVHNTCWNERLAMFMEYVGKIETKSLTSQEATINHLENIFKMLDRTSTDDVVLKLVGETNVYPGLNGSKIIYQAGKQGVKNYTEVFVDGGFQIIRNGKVVISKVK